MNLEHFQRAMLVDFAYQQAAHTGSLPAMKAVALVIRNRVRGGWCDSDWLRVIQEADEVAGNDPAPAVWIDANSRAFRVLLQSIDEIYYAQPSDEALEKAVGKALFYQFTDRPVRDWFTQHVVRQPDHPRHAVIGATMMLYD